ncbi:uncharacterized protein KY384_001888 [Bacidia gigantensis]|uniref:uncharacterized protein n=1 Tax=Bacidia gigantensis TaxID=2732470 RepID=UPI001D03F13B|nr:uncharacterized protein KY384_001888 [Bacidia gigantensis]KAG8533105.1 hypothetical protein KY384_001888 [Bacidia gigantensis]
MSDLFVDLTAPNGRKYTQPRGLFINNEFVPSKSGDRITSINPSDETPIASVYAGSAPDIDAAVAAARSAFKNPSWHNMSATDRGNLMMSLATLVEKHAETLATIETWDNGKPYSVSLGEDLAEVAGTLRYYGGWADKIHGEVINTSPDKLAYTLREPVGVCGQIIPWNYPVATHLARHGGLETRPSTRMRQYSGPQARRANSPQHSLLRPTNHRSRLPPGVINIVNGTGPDAGTALASHLDVDKIAFTGSTATGKKIMKMAASNLKNITLETGGKSPLIVFADAEMEQAVKWAHVGIMSNQGQICTATSRILVEEGVYDSFIEKFTEQVKTTSKVGDPFEEATFQGPQVTKAQFERVLGYIESGKSEGATLVAGGEAQKDVNGGHGFFVAPTVFANVKDGMRIYREEVFGPFVVISSFKSEEEAVERANDTTYGLGAAVFTENLTKAHRVARAIEAGMVWINSSNDSDWRIPFGGVKQSGVGRELGEEGLKAYTVCKAVHVNMGTRL